MVAHVAILKRLASCRAEVFRFVRDTWEGQQILHALDMCAEDVRDILEKEAKRASKADRRRAL